MEKLYDKNVIKKVQCRILEMATATRDILESNNIPYFITYGTLLGAVKYKGFVPWDDDFDFYLFSDSYDDALCVLRKELPSNYFVEYFDTEPLYFHSWAHVKDLKSKRVNVAFPRDQVYAHHGITIDLYRTVKINENEEKMHRAQEHLEYLDRLEKFNLMDISEITKRRKKLFQIVEEENRAIVNRNEQQRQIFAFNKGYNDWLYIEELFPLKRYEFERNLFWGPNNAHALLSRCYGDYSQLPPMEARKPHSKDYVFFD